MLSLRDTILNEVHPANVHLGDPAQIVAEGVAAIPIIVDLFSHPYTPHGDINQAILADALIAFAKKGNADAVAFAEQIARGQVPLTQSWGQTAQQIVTQHIASTAPPSPKEEKQTPSALKPVTWSEILTKYEKQITGDPPDDRMVDARMRTIYKSFEHADLALSAISNEIAGKLSPSDEGHIALGAYYCVTHSGKLTGAQAKEFLTTVVSRLGEIGQVILKYTETPAEITARQLRERQKQEAKEKQAAIERTKIEIERKARNECIICGKLLGFFNRFFKMSQHSKCAKRR